MMWGKVVETCSRRNLGLECVRWRPSRVWSRGVLWSGFGSNRIPLAVLGRWSAGDKVARGRV